MPLLLELWLPAAGHRHCLNWAIPNYGFICFNKETSKGVESRTQTIIAIIIVKCLTKHLQLRHSLLIALINLSTEQLMRFPLQGKENDSSQQHLRWQPAGKPRPGSPTTCMLGGRHLSAEQSAAPGETTDQTTLGAGPHSLSQNNHRPQMPGGMTNAYQEPVLLRCQSKQHNNNSNTWIWSSSQASKAGGPTPQPLLFCSRQSRRTWWFPSPKH